MPIDFNFTGWLILGLVAVIAYLAFDSYPFFWPSWYSGDVLEKSSKILQVAIIFGFSFSGPIGFVIVAGLYALGGLQKMQRNRGSKVVEQKK